MRRRYPATTPDMAMRRAESCISQQGLAVSGPLSFQFRNNGQHTTFLLER